MAEPSKEGQTLWGIVLFLLILDWEMTGKLRKARGLVCAVCCAAALLGNAQAQSSDTANTSDHIGDTRETTAAAARRRVAAIESAAPPLDTRALTDALLGLSTAEIGLKRHAEAQTHLRRALTLNETSHLLAPDDVLASRWLLAWLLQQTGRLSEAATEYENVLQARRKTGQAAAVAQDLRHLGRLYEQMGQFARAEASAREAINMLEALNPDNRMELTHALQLLGDVLQSEARYAEAETAMQRALYIREQQLGAKHEDVAVSVGNLGELYREQGLLEKARPLLERAMAILRESRGEDDMDTASVANNLALIHIEQDQPALALGLLEPAMRTALKVHGAGHPFTLQVLHNRGVAHVHAADQKTGEALLRQALNQRLAMPHGELAVTETATALGVLMFAQDRLQEAEYFMNQGMVATRLLAPTHPSMRSLFELAERIYDKTGRAAEARQVRKLLQTNAQTKP
jgi:tetratricopeptide (TPR) repeat protein